MKILHIKHNLQKISGITSILLELIESQNKEHKVFLLTNKNMTTSTEKYIKVSSYLSFIEEYNPEIVIFHGIYFFHYIKISKYLLKHKIPYLVMPHASLSIVGQKRKYIKKKMGNYLFFNKFLKNSKGLIYLNEKEKLESVIKFTNEFIIPNGVKNKKIKFNDKNGLKIIFLGRLNIYHKGIDIYMKGLEKVKDQLLEKEIKIYIYGEGEDKKDIQLLIKEKFLEEIVILKGGIFGKEKEELLKSSNIMILTSRFEGMPMSLLEATSYGISLFVTNETNLGKEVKKYNAGKVISLNENTLGQDFINFIDSYLSNKKKYYNNVLELFNNEFNIDKVCKKSIKIYKGVIKNVD